MRLAGLLAILVALIAGSLPSIALAQTSGQTHIVQNGETLTSIANKYGVTVDAISAANKLNDANAIVVGQRLIIPGKAGSGAVQSAQSVQSSPGTYTIQPGDTLTGIANQFGLSVDQLAAANKIPDPALIRIGQVLKIPDPAASVSVSDPAAPALPALADGQYTFTPAGNGPAIQVEVSGGRLISLTLQATSTGKQLLPLSCEAKIAAQLAAMYGLSFDEMSFLGRLPHSLDPRRGFVGSIMGRFYWPGDVIGNTADGPGGYGVHVEGWMPVFQALSGFQTRFLASGWAAAEAQIDAALRRGYPVAAWAVLGFRAPLTQNSVWIGPGPGGTAINCGGPGPACAYLASGEHAYLILGRRDDSYLIYDPGNGEIGYFSRTAVITGITTLFAVPTGSAPGAIIVPSAGHVPDLRQLPGW